MAGGAIYTKREFAGSEDIAGALTRNGAGVVWLVFCVIAFDGILRNGCLPLSRLRKYPTGAASLLTQGLVFR